MIFSPDNWPRVSALLDSALELPEEQRISWIDSVTVDSPEIKSQLSALLAGTSQADELLCKPPDIAAALLVEAQRFQQIEIELQPDKLIGPYRLLRELGKGGMGTVWLAQRADGKFKREVALKFPYAGPRQRELTERLIRERDILASLEHPNIARLYDADVTASGQPFLVLEYIDGIAINHYCDQHQLDIRERLKLFQQVLSAVRYAHNHLVIHRDIKPSNILITADGMVHLLDFGVAKSIIDDENDESPLTQFGGHVLTPEYASPEQIARVAVTTVSDVYTAGVVLYELLVGRSPYKWQRDQRAQLEEAIGNADVLLPSRAIISNETAADRSTQPRQLSKALHGELDTLLLKALKKNPAQRYASADAFHEDIARYLDHQPILAQPDSQWYRVRKFARRNRIAVASFAAIAVALIAGTGIALWQAHVAAQQTRLAAQQRDRAVALARRGEAITEFMRLMVTETADADKPITMQTLLERAEKIAFQSFVGNKEQQIAVLEVLGGYYLELHQSGLARQSYNKALLLAVDDSDAALKARLNCGLGRADRATGDASAALAHINSGLALAIGYPEAHIECLLSHADYISYTSDMKYVLQDLEAAKEELSNSKLNQSTLAVEILLETGDTDLELGHIVEAKRSYANAFQKAVALGRDKMMLGMYIQRNWADAESFSGNPRSALEHLDMANAIALDRAGSDKQKVTFCTVTRAALLYKLARYDESLREFRLALAYGRKNHDEFDVMKSTLGIMRVNLLQGHLGEAQHFLNEAKDMMHGRIHANDGVDAQNYLFFKGLLSLTQYRAVDAVTSFSENINFFQAHNQFSTPLAYNLVGRGESYYSENNLTVALADASQAYNIARSLQDKSGYSCYSGEAALLLAKIYHAKNENGEARNWAMIAYQQLQGSVGANHPDTLEAKHLLDSLQATH